MQLQAQNGGKTPFRWGSIAKFLTLFLPMITALVTAVVALRETKGKTSEVVSKAAHDELVLQLKALNHDLGSLTKQMDKLGMDLRQELRLGVAEAKARSESVRALFTGYALAARQNVAPSKTVETVREVVQEAQKKAEDLVMSAPKSKPTASPRSFKQPKSWDTIQQQTQGPPSLP